MGPWKAVRLQKDAPLELYNLDADPFEQRDVAAIQPDASARIEKYLTTARTESSLWPVLARKRANQPGETADTTELTRLEHVWNEAHVRGDAEALDRLWSDEFVVTVPGMTVLTKAEAIGVWRSGKMKFQRYETSDLRVRVYNDAAVVTGRLRRTRHFNDREMDDDWRFTKVYVRSAGRWQVVAFHASTVAQ
jgi:ketosteroid isomerase-like protein